MRRHIGAIMGAVFLGLSTAASAQTADATRPSVSEEVSSAISAGITYQPAPATPPTEESPDVRDVDPPRNSILRLPKHIVESPRPPVFSERALHPQGSLAQLAYARHFSPFQRNVLNRYRLPFIGQTDVAYALMQYEAEERERNMAETSEKIDLYRETGDEEEAEQLEEDMEEAFMRRTPALPALSIP